MPHVIPVATEKKRAVIIGTGPAGMETAPVAAEGGGSNGVRCRAWKAFIQTCLADRYQIPVTVCHFPPGTLKWNPIEHLLFSEISKNWSGQPLDSHETIVK